MDMSRKDFVIAAAAGLVTSQAVASDAKAPKTKLMKVPKPKAGQTTMMGFVAPKLNVVRCAFIGVGARGSGHVESLLQIEGVEVVAICDTHEPSRKASIDRVVKAGRKEPAAYGAKGDRDFEQMLKRDDIDAVFIATPWEWHAPMAKAAMKAGKHAFVEVPMCLTIDECWQLVDTSEQTRKYCMMMENVNYGREELLVLNMCRMGVFGELLHGEAAYIHDLRGQMLEVGHGTGSWRTLHYATRNGNLYPTHGLGPVAQYMNINRGDRFDYMSSVSSPSRARALYAKTLPDSNPHKKLKYVCGDISTSIIKTVVGKTIMVQWDEQLPRPYNRLNLLQGTEGVWGGFPHRCVIDGISESTDSWDTGEKLKKFYEKFEHPLWKRMGEEAKKNGGHGGMDFIMLWRIIYCLRNGEPIDQDVYDGAAWTAVSPLSEWSVANRGQSIDFPDFSRGAWKSGKPLGIVS